MNDTNVHGEDRVGISPVISAVAGAVVGAGIAVAGAFLSDKKNQEKISDTASKVKDNVSSLINKSKSQIAVGKEDLENKIATDSGKVHKIVDSAKHLVDKTTKEVNKAVKAL